MSLKEIKARHERTGLCEEHDAGTWEYGIHTDRATLIGWLDSALLELNHLRGMVRGKLHKDRAARILKLFDETYGPLGAP